MGAVEKVRVVDGVKDPRSRKSGETWGTRFWGTRLDLGHRPARNCMDPSSGRERPPQDDNSG